LDEARGALYVTDNDNNRIQKFIIGGNGTAVTVAGNLASGTGLNQLKQPAGLCVTRDGQTLYVADYGNNRVMKWPIGASQGSVVAGNANGVSGSTSQLLNGPADVALDPSETYLYVSDYGNHRIQRFRLQ
jgi:sugar lactone lactonase YvrE